MQRRTFFGAIAAAVAGLFVKKATAQPLSGQHLDYVTVTEVGRWPDDVHIPDLLFEVTILKHSPNTRYETLREFETYQEAYDFVQNLYPRIASITLAADNTENSEQVLKSGYRGAIRAFYRHNEIVTTVFEIIDKRTGEVIVPTEYDGCFIFNCSRAWAIIENVRLDGTPVDMRVTRGETRYSNLPPYLSEPFDIGKDNIHYVDLVGNPIA